MRARLYLQVPGGIRIQLHGRVADLLIEADAMGQEISGLEIAWHCMRARKPVLATPYLMQGARRAIGTGASDEAARALSTALKHLKGRDRDEGIILLAETLQEMADWKGSLEVLEEIERKRKIDPELGGIRDILILNARRGISYYSVPDQEALALKVLDEISTLSSEAACRSVLLLARIASDLRNQHLSQRVKQAIADLSADKLPPRLRAMRDLALAMCVHYIGQNELSLSILRQCINNLPDLADSTGVSLYTGIGANCSRLGDYELARQASERALAMSKRLGNDLLSASAYGNLALQTFRLGEYEMARDCAATAYRLSLSQPAAPFDRIRGAYFAGMSEAFGRLNGDHETSIQNLASAAKAAERPWNRQFAYFYLADLYFVRGHIRSAIKAAKQGIEMSALPLTSSVSGAYARWLAIVTAKSKDPNGGLQRLNRIGEEYPLLDLLDCAELDCSVLYLMASIGMTDDDRATRLRRRLAALPLPVSHQLGRLGILPGGRVADSIPEAVL
jgi:tetratricopeptide (TPR) repeat protein